MRDEMDDVYPGRLRACCEIGSAVGAIVGGGLSLLGGAMGASAAGDAADAQVEAARIAAEVQREALGFQKETFDIGRADLDPYRATGGAALHTLSDLFIPGGQSVVQMQSKLNELRARRAVLARSGDQPASPVQQAAAGDSGFGNLLYGVTNESQRQAVLTHPLANARTIYYSSAASEGEGGAGGAR